PDRHQQPIVGFKLDLQRNAHVPLLRAGTAAEVRSGHSQIWVFHFHRSADQWFVVHARTAEKYFEQFWGFTVLMFVRKRKTFSLETASDTAVTITTRPSHGLKSRPPVLP